MKSTPLERLAAMAVICQTHDDGKPESRLSRLHYAVGKKSVENLVVGGYAVRFHGFTRYTGNVDFFVSISESNAQRLLEVFQDFGFGDIGIEKEDFLKPSFLIEIGQEPRKIQVLTGIDGVTFEECQKSAVDFDYSGQKIRFIGLQELIRNKKASGRSKE